MTPVRITLSRKKGFDLQRVSLALNGLPAVNCARPGRWGNMFQVCDDRTAYKACVMFMAVVEAGTHKHYNVKNVRAELRGKNLACWCKESPCHCDVLLIIANKPCNPTRAGVEKSRGTKYEK